MRKKNRRREERDAERNAERKEQEMLDWVPKTETGKMVRDGLIESVEQVREKGLPLMEPHIIDALLPGLEEKLVDLKKTARVTRQGRNFSFRASVLVGDRNGHIGVGTSKDAERLAAIKKAANKARLSMISVKRGCGSWECTCRANHSVPFKVEGKCSSVRVKLLPAPKGVGLVVGENIKAVLEFAGIRDVWSQTRGASSTKLNFVLAAVDALRGTATKRLSEDIKRKLEREKGE